MTIAFVTTQVISRHATFKRAVELGGALARTGQDVVVLAEDHPDNRAAVARAGLRLLPHPSGVSAREERSAKESHLRALRPEIVSLCGLGWRNFLLRESSPASFWIADFDELIPEIPLFPWWFRRLQRVLEDRALRRYDGVVAASRYLHHHYLDCCLRLGLGKVPLYLPYAYEDEFRARVVRGEGRSREGAVPEIVYMGSHWRTYGCFLMAEALALLAKRRSDWKATLYGRGPDTEELKARLAASGLAERVRLPGYVGVDDLQQGILDGDIFLSPLFSTRQDWARCPSKTYVYVATGKPIVTAPIGENLHALGDEALYYPAGSAEGMSRAIERALEALPRWKEPDYVPRHAWSRRAEEWLRWTSRRREEVLR